MLSSSPAACLVKSCNQSAVGTISNMLLSASPCIHLPRLQVVPICCSSIKHDHTAIMRKALGHQSLHQTTSQMVSILSSCIVAAEGLDACHKKPSCELVSALAPCSGHFVNGKKTTADMPHGLPVRKARKRKSQLCISPRVAATQQCLACFLQARWL